MTACSGEIARPRCRARASRVERGNAHLHRLERVGVRMVEKRLAASRQLGGHVFPGAPAASDGGAHQRERQGDATGRRQDDIRFRRQGVRPRVGHAGKQLAGGRHRQYLDALDVRPDRPENGGITGRVQDPATRPGGPEGRRGGGGPHIVDDQQAAAVGKRLAQELKPAARRPKLSVRHPEAGEKPDLGLDQVALLAHRHPEHAVGEVAAHALVPSQGSGQHRLADPSLARQPQRPAGDADRAVASA